MCRMNAMGEPESPSLSTVPSSNGTAGWLLASEIVVGKLAKPRGASRVK